MESHSSKFGAIAMVLLLSSLSTISLMQIVRHKSLRFEINSSKVCGDCTPVLININHNCKIASDINNITHLQNESKIIVHFKKQRYCPQPQLVGRLSGPALSIVTWEKDNELDDDDGDSNSNSNSDVDGDDNGDYDVLVGHYHVPMSGQFFVEIIVTMCTELRNETDFQGICLEDPSRHRLTSKNSSIHANPPAEDKSKLSTTIGHWYNTKNASAEKHEALYTRYQPPNCRDSEANAPRCKKFTDISRFEPYEYKFATELTLDNVLKGKDEKICFEGASHANVLTVTTNLLLKKFESNVTVLPPVGEEGTKFAFNFAQEAKIQSFINKKCTKVIAGTGQWDAGWPESVPTLFPAFENHLSTAMPMMKKMLGDANIDLYFRSMHYNPIGDMIGACPPGDWRSPTVIDMYNKIIKQLCEKYDIPLIETNDIMGIMWDRASDFCHYNDVSSKMEATYILSRILNQDISQEKH